MVEEIHPSLNRIYEISKLSKPSEIAKELNVSASTITNWATRGVSKNGAKAASKKFGSTMDYILYGAVTEPLIHASQINSGQFNNTSINQHVNSDQVFYQTKQTDVVSIRFYQHASISRLDDYKLGVSTIEQISPVSVNALFSVPVMGKDMHPVLTDKAIAIADESKDSTNIYDGQIYALKMGNNIRCRYLEQLSGGRMRVYSESNKDGEIFNGEEFSQHYQIMGGVLSWISFANW